MMNTISDIKHKNTSNTKSIEKTSDGTDQMLCEISDVCK